MSIKSVIVIFVLSISFGLVNALTIKSTILNAKTKECLVYANVMVSNISKGTSTDEGGTFILNLDESLLDSILIISHVGFKTKRMTVRGLGGVIYLEPKEYELNEVVVAVGKKPKTLFLNRIKKKKCMLRYSTVPFGGGDYFIPIKPDEPQVESIYFPCDSLHFNKQLLSASFYFNNLEDTLSIVRIRIFDVDKHGYPQHDILNQSLLIDVRGDRDQLVNVDLEKYGLVMPQEGLFIGCESLIIPENTSQLSDGQGKSVKVIVPHLYLIAQESRMGYFFYSQGKWIKSKYWYVVNNKWSMLEEEKETTKNQNLYVFTPAISLELSK